MTDLTFNMANTIAAATQHAALTEKISYQEAIDVMAWLIKSRPNEPVEKFKIGSRVRNKQFPSIGEGTIVSVPINGDDWYVQWDSHKTGPYSYFKSSLEVVND